MAATSEWDVLHKQLTEVRATVDALESRTPNLDGQDFYELCQAYRHALEIPAHPGLPTPAAAFQNIKQYLKTGELPWPSYESH